MKTTIVTTQAETPFEGQASAEAGSMGTSYFRAGVGGKTERLTWRLALAQPERFQTAVLVSLPPLSEGAPA